MASVVNDVIALYVVSNAEIRSKRPMPKASFNYTTVVFVRRFLNEWQDVVKPILGLLAPGSHGFPLIPHQRAGDVMKRWRSILNTGCVGGWRHRRHIFTSTCAQ